MGRVFTATIGTHECHHGRVRPLVNLRRGRRGIRMSQALKLWLTPHQIVEQTGTRLAANLDKIDYTGCHRIGQLIGTHPSPSLRASPIIRPPHSGEARASTVSHAAGSTPAG